MKHSIQVKAKVPTIITATFLVAALAFSFVLHLVSAAQTETQNWYPEEYWDY